MRRLIYWQHTPFALDILSLLAFAGLVGMLVCTVMLGWPLNGGMAFALTVVIASSTIAKDEVLISQDMAEAQSS